MITQRSTYQAENWTSNTKKPHQVIPQSYFRYEPISPSYDPYEFVKNYNKKSHQKFRQLRPAKKRPHQWIFEFFLRDWLELDEILPIIATKTKNSKKICEKKFVSKSPFQGLEPLPQILNKLGRNKKLNPSSRNAKGKAWYLCKIVGTAYFQTRKWPLCYRLIPDTTTPKTSPIEQITDRWEPKNSNLQRVTLQCLTSCYRWSNLLRDNVSNLALASAQNPPKIWKYAWKILIFLLWFLTFWPPFDIVRLHPIG